MQIKMLRKMVGNAEISAYVYETSLTHVISIIYINLATSVVFAFRFYRHANVFSAVENINKKRTYKAVIY